MGVLGQRDLWTHELSQKKPDTGLALKHIHLLERGLTLSGNLNGSGIERVAWAVSASQNPAVIAMSGRDADHKKPDPEKPAVNLLPVDKKEEKHCEGIDVSVLAGAAFPPST